MRTTGTPSRPQRPMRADARRNYQQLLAAARSAFMRQGTDASLEEVARQAGVGIGTLYRHFPTREALLEALLGDRFDALSAQARDLLTAPSPRDALVTLMRAYVAHAATYRGLTAALMATLRDETSQLHASCLAMRTAAARLLTRAQQAGDVRADVDATDVFVLINALAWATEQMPPDDQQTDRLLSLLMDGLATKTPQTPQAQPGHQPSA